MVLKKDMKGKKPKGLKKRPPKKPRSSLLGKVVVLDGKREIDRRTGMNRDIPMGGAGGSSNLMSNLVGRGLAVSQPQPSIQTPDQFKLAEDIKGIRSEQAGIAEEIAIQKKERKERSDKGKPRPRGAKINVATENMPEGAIPTTATESVQVPMSAGGAVEEEQYVRRKNKQTGKYYIVKVGQEAMTSPMAKMEPPMSAGGDPLLRQPDPMKPKKVNTTAIPYDDIQAPLADPNMPTSLAPEGEPK